MTLLLDLGNSRLKWTQVDAGRIATARALAWDADDFEAKLRGALAAVPVPERLLAASVAGDAREARVAEAARDALAMDIEWVRTPAAACGVRNAYPEPGRLGIDRFLAMVAAYDAGLTPCVLVGAGTALTLDALAADGTHLGGLIAPGPWLMQRSLLQATARVHPREGGRVVDAADDTTDAVYSGCWHAAAALVERFAARMAARLGGSPALLLGGGDAAALAALLDAPAQVREDPVLNGLAVWARDA